MNYKSWNQVLLGLLVALFLINTWIVKMAINCGSRYDEEFEGMQRHRDTLLETVRLLQAHCGSKQDAAQSAKGPVCTGNISIDKEKAVVLGRRKAEKGFLTIGIPTVYRISNSYLEQTLDSLLEHTTHLDRKEITIVVFIADLEEIRRVNVQQALAKKYKDAMEEHFLHVITAPRSFYPPLFGLKQNFGDSVERVKWRAKQVVDYAYLFSYCHELSTYFLQLEDDVLATPNYFQGVKDFISANEDKPWTSLSFSPLGFIAKLYRSSDLLRLAQFSLAFYEEQPIDFLYRYFNVLHAQEEPLLRAPSLFRHIGLNSSLRNKKQLAKDIFLEDVERKYPDCDNPTAVIYTNMKRFSMYSAELAYNSEPGYFWAKSINTGDYFNIEFEIPQFLAHVVIETGSTGHPQDILQDGDLSIGGIVLPHVQNPKCHEFQIVGKFVDGRVEVTNFKDIVQYKVKCLSINVLQGQVQWLLIREVAVWVRK